MGLNPTRDETIFRPLVCPGLSIKWTGRCLATDSGTKCAWVIHESKAVQIHVHNSHRSLCVPRVPGSIKNPHNNNSRTNKLLHCSNHKVVDELLTCNSNGLWKSVKKKEFIVTIYGNGFVCPTL